MNMRKLRTDELNRLNIEEFKTAPKTPVVVVLDNVRSLLNVGSIFRTADAFRFEKILLCGITPVPNKEMNKTALGATESMIWEHIESSLDAISTLKDDGYQIIGIEQTNNSKQLSEIKEYKYPVAFVLGHEVKGVSIEVLELCDEIIEIPQIGTKHSLNVSVSGGIIAWELFKIFKQKKG